MSLTISPKRLKTKDQSLNVEGVEASFKILMKVSKRKFFNCILSKIGCEENVNDTPQTVNNVQQ